MKKLKIKKIASLFSILFIGLIILQGVEAPSVFERADVNVFDEPKSAASTFTIENFSNDNINVSLFNLEGNGTYHFADTALGETPNYISGTDSSIEIDVVQNCSVGLNQSLLRFRANTGKSSYKSVANFQTDFNINRCEYIFRWDGVAGGLHLGLSINNSGLIYFNQYHYAFQGDNWFSHGLDLTKWNKISIVNNGASWQLLLNGVLKYTSQLTITGTNLSVKIYANNNSVSDYSYIDSIDLGTETTKQNFIDQIIDINDLFEFGYFENRKYAYNTNVYRGNSKTINVESLNYYIINKDLLEDYYLDFKTASSYCFIGNKPNVEFISESPKSTRWVAHVQKLNRSISPVFTANVSHVLPKHRSTIYSLGPNSIYNMDDKPCLPIRYIDQTFHGYGYDNAHSLILFDHCGNISDFYFECFSQQCPPWEEPYSPPVEIYAYDNDEWYSNITWNSYHSANISESNLGTIYFPISGTEDFINHSLESPEPNKSFIFKTFYNYSSVDIHNNNKLFARVLNDSFELTNKKFKLSENVILNKTIDNVKNDSFIEFNLNYSNYLSGYVQIADRFYQITSTNQTIRHYFKSDYDFLDIKINVSISNFADLSCSDLKIYDFTQSYRSFYLNPLGVVKFSFLPNSYFISIYESNELKEIKDITISSIDADLIMTLIYSIDSSLNVQFYLIDDLNNALNFNNFIITARYQKDNINQTKILDSPLLFVDLESTLDIIIKDKIFSKIVFNDTLSATDLLVLRISVFNLRIKNNLAITSKLFINSTMFYLFSGEIIELQLPESNYNILYHDENNEEKSQQIYLNNTFAFELKSAYRNIYFSIFDITGLGLDLSTVRFYLNNLRTEFRAQKLIGESAHLLVLDFFNATIYNQTVSIVDITEFNIYVPVFTLSLFNNYSEPVIVVIERDGLGFTNLEQQISPQTGLEYRFLANVEYTISILHLNGTELETRTVNLTENKQLSFGFYSAEISKEDLKTTLNDLLFLISIVLGLGAVFLVSFIYSYAKLTNRDARIVKKVKKAGKTGRDDRDFLGGY